MVAKSGKHLGMKDISAFLVSIINNGTYQKVGNWNFWHQHVIISCWATKKTLWLSIESWFFSYDWGRISSPILYPKQLFGPFFQEAHVMCCFFREKHGARLHSLSLRKGCFIQGAPSKSASAKMTSSKPHMTSRYFQCRWGNLPSKWLVVEGWATSVIKISWSTSKLSPIFTECRFSICN